MNSIKGTGPRLQIFYVYIFLPLINGILACFLFRASPDSPPRERCKRCGWCRLGGHEIHSLGEGGACGEKEKILRRNFFFTYGFAS